MKKCEKCNVNLDIFSNKCPLCNSEVKDVKSFESSYPELKNIVSNKMFRKVLFFLTCIISIIAVVMNYFLTPSYKWSLFVVLQIFSSYYIFYNILSGQKKVIKLLFVLNIFVSVLSIFWDFYIGFKGWSVNYVIPSLCITYGIFMLILRLVNYYAFRENSSYIYLNICLEFVPVIMVFFDKAELNVLVYLSALFGILHLLILLIFDGSSFKDDIVKKLHI